VRSLAFSTDPAFLEAAYALHRAQARDWPRDRMLPLELSRRLLVDGADAPVARLFTLADARGPVSAALAQDGPAETFVWWSGTHADGRRRGAFALLLWRIAEWAHANGRQRVNLGASTGLEQVAFFKHGMGTVTSRYPVRWLDARNAPPVGRAVAWLQSQLRRRRARGEAA
jgi:GNAT superfamily N-acetyltransferase